MGEALRLARKAYEAEEVPVGAVVVREGKIIGRAYNQVEDFERRDCACGNARDDTGRGGSRRLAPDRLRSLCHERTVSHVRRRIGSRAHAARDLWLYRRARRRGWRHHEFAATARLKSSMRNYFRRFTRRMRRTTAKFFSGKARARLATFVENFGGVNLRSPNESYGSAVPEAVFTIETSVLLITPLTVTSS